MGYCTSTYTQGIPRLHQYIIIVKTSQPLQVQIMSGSRFLLGDLPFTPYPYSQGGGLFGQKSDQRTLILRYSGNATSPTVKPLTVKGSHKKSFHVYNLLAFITLHTNHRYIPRYWRCPTPFDPSHSFCQSDKSTPCQVKSDNIT